MCDYKEKKVPQVEAEELYNGAEAGAEVRASWWLLTINGLS